MILATIKAAGASPKVDTIELYAFLFLLALFLGLELIAKVPAKLHTPLMSGSNAISGITLIGAMVLASKADSPALAIIMGSAAVTFAAINVVGGYFVTDRMLEMFKKKEEPKGGQS